MILPMWVLFGLLGAAELQPGASLAELIDHDTRFVAISGTLPMPVAGVAAPQQAGPHWLAQWVNLDQPPKLTRFVVAGEVGTVLPITIELDREAPGAVLRWAGVAVDAPATAVGPRSQAQLETDDRTGVASATLLVDGVPRTLAEWATGLTSGAHKFSAQVEDVLGNRADLELGLVQVDLDAPVLQPLAVESARDGWVGKPPYRVSVSAVDSSPPVALTIADAADGCAGSDRVRCSVSVAEFDIHAEDALGNQVVVRERLKVDRDGPELRTEPHASDQQRIDVRVGDSVLFDASDNSGAIPTSCARFHHKPCQRLPRRVRAADPGIYWILVEAIDDFGNRSSARYRIQVRP